MSLDYRTATSQYQNLKNRLAPGAVATLPNGREYLVMGPALHSETLEPLMVLLDDSDPLAPAWTAVAPGALRLSGESAALPQAIERILDLAVFRHVKGGVYTRLAQARARDGEMTLYAAHADGTWWLRPRAMFEDGRFEASPEDPLDHDELGL